MIQGGGRKGMGQERVGTTTLVCIVREPFPFGLSAPSSHGSSNTADRGGRAREPWTCPP